MNFLYILVAILIFGILIAVHEGGHFAAAKLCGVRVDEFSIGMGPAIFKKQRGETLYSLRCIPIGGYCAMAGEDEQSDDPRAFTSQKAWKRVVILAAGAFMNLVTGFVIVLILYSNAAAFRAPVIDSFMEGCPYDSPEALQAGDRFYSIDGHRIFLYSDVPEYLSEGVHDIVMIRDGQKRELNDFELVTREFPGQEGKYFGFYFGLEDATVLGKLKYSWYTTQEFGRWVFEGLRMLISGEAKATDLSGPVGIVDLMAQTGEQAESVGDAMYSIFYLGALIAVNLALMNLLPIPALDGGRIFFLIVTELIVLVTGKKPDPKYEGYIHAAGMLLLLALMGVVMFNDIVKIVRK